MLGFFSKNVKFVSNALLQILSMKKFFLQANAYPF